MSSNVSPVPAGFHTVTPYLTINGAAAAIEFYQRAFGAVERFRMLGPDGKSVGHAEIKIGDSIIMLADESPYGKSPKTLGGSPVSIVLYVEDVDSFFQKAVEAGVTIMRPLQDQFYGDRSATVIDPFGHCWHLMTHKENVSPAEMDKRLAAFYAKMAAEKK